MGVGSGGQDVGQDVGQDGGRGGCHGMSSLRCRGRMASCWGGGGDGCGLEKENT